MVKEKVNPRIAKLQETLLDEYREDLVGSKPILHLAKHCIFSNELRRGSWWMMLFSCITMFVASVNYIHILWDTFLISLGAFVVASIYNSVVTGRYRKARLVYVKPEFWTPEDIFLDKIKKTKERSGSA